MYVYYWLWNATCWFSQNIGFTGVIFNCHLAFPACFYLNCLYLCSNQELLSPNTDGQCCISVNDMHWGMSWNYHTNQTNWCCCWFKSQFVMQKCRLCITPCKICSMLFFEMNCLNHCRNQESLQESKTTQSHRDVQCCMCIIDFNRGTSWLSESVIAIWLF